MLGFAQSATPQVLDFFLGFTSADINFQNFGKGPAIIDRVVAGLMLVDTSPNLRDFSNCDERAPTIEVISAGKNFGFTSILVQHLRSASKRVPRSEPVQNLLLARGCF